MITSPLRCAALRAAGRLLSALNGSGASGEHVRAAVRKVEDAGNPDAEVGRRLVGYLADLAAAWQVATPAERNKFARQLLVEAVLLAAAATSVVAERSLRRAG